MVHILRSTSLWGGGGLPDTIMPTFRGGGGKKYPKMYYVVCERSLMLKKLEGMAPAPYPIKNRVKSQAPIQ